MPKQKSKSKSATRAAALRGHGSKHASGFVDFIREQGIVGLAVGLAIGVAAGEAIKSIVDNFVNPIIGYILGGADLSNMVWNTGLMRGDAELSFGRGAIVSAIITLLATAFVIYCLVHAAKLDRLDKKKD